MKCVDVAQGEELPGEVLSALTDPRVAKTAFNANFERVCLSRWLGMPAGSYLDPRQWSCTMVAAARMGLPLSLGECAKVLHLSEGKMEEGRALIRYFSKPDSKGRRRLPTDSWDRWATFKEYNIRDVEVERGVLAKVRWERPPTRSTSPSSNAPARTVASAACCNTTVQRGWTRSTRPVCWRRPRN